MRSSCGVSASSNRGKSAAELGLMEKSISWFGPFKLPAALWLGYSLPGTPKVRCVRSLAISEPRSPNTHILSKLSESLNPFFSGLIMPLASEKRN